MPINRPLLYCTAVNFKRFTALEAFISSIYVQWNVNLACILLNKPVMACKIYRFNGGSMEKGVWS